MNLALWFSIQLLTCRGDQFFGVDWFFASYRDERDNPRLLLGILSSALILVISSYGALVHFHLLVRYLWGTTTSSIL